MNTASCKLQLQVSIHDEGASELMAWETCKSRKAKIFLNHVGLGTTYCHAVMMHFSGKAFTMPT